MTFILREASELKNGTKCGKSPKGEGGVSSENQKVHNSKCGLFDKMGGGGQIFRFFPYSNLTTSPIHLHYLTDKMNKWN